MEYKEFLSVEVLSIVALVWIIDTVWRIEFGSFYQRYGASSIPDKMLFDGEKGISDIFWGIMYGLIIIFVQIPFEAGELMSDQVFARGFLIGMAIYMLYDLFNRDVVYHWSMLLILVDVAWGGFLVGLFTHILLV